MGTIILLLSMIAANVYALLWFTGSPPPGITTIIVLLLVAIGLNSIGIGILGEYVGRTYAESKHRPLYVVQEAVNIESSIQQEVAVESNYADEESGQYSRQ
ncbi:MAG: hypothetical protein DMF68_05985 [Acidobacteria bacterium]|nr:MAG: hypothetical protein DMF68_05985 [Acidobacteriota bacterium]